MIKNEDNSLIIIKYINFYKFCTTIIKFDNGSIKFVNKMNKLSTISLKENLFNNNYN